MTMGMDKHRRQKMQVCPQWLVPLQVILLPAKNPDLKVGHHCRLHDAAGTGIAQSAFHGPWRQESVSMLWRAVHPRGAAPSLLLPPMHW
mmetsp:Transcript_37147/g.61179  ORF Transcript_37147/g.61179 Transcript_37147/m.61179 type:complete len:89 (+) Transcript_37147:903-1169(+)